MKILLHICCVNCAIYPVKTVLEEGHGLTGFWFNPNIHPFEEYNLRLDSLRDFAGMRNIDMIYKEYKPEDFNEAVKPDNLSSPIYNPPTSPFSKGGQRGIINSGVAVRERCKSCYRLRLEETAHNAAKEGFDAFSTTLLISPYQSFEEITNIGSKLAGKYNVQFYLKDFRPDFSTAMAVSKQLGFYRQKYCGCKYSMEERKQKVASR
ncbi:MAG: epoxyqueuosine reductase QueH [Nitrospirae bacterium]|nr:epoxyqueuosine reductase QueH [Nitrospirota bacterium]